MYNPIIYALIISIIITSLSEIYYKVREKDDTHTYDKDNKSKYQIMIFLGTFIIMYIFKICTYKKEDISSIDLDIESVVSDDIGNIESMKVPF